MDRKIRLCAALALSGILLCSTASAGLVGWWTFDETTGNTAKDSSGQANDGRIVGAPQWVPGKIGGALEFNGSTYVDGIAVATANIADVDGLDQFPIYGRHTCIYADVANTNPITVTAIGVVK